MNKSVHIFDKNNSRVFTVPEDGISLVKNMHGAGEVEYLMWVHGAPMCRVSLEQYHQLLDIIGSDGVKVIE